MPQAIVALLFVLAFVWLLKQLPLTPQVNLVVVVVALIVVAWLALWHFGWLG